VGLHFHKGALYVADRDNHVARMIAAVTNGSCGGSSGYTGLCVTTVAGQPKQAGYKDGAAAAALLKQPHDVALASDGSLLIADTGNHAIRKRDAQGKVATLAGTGKAGVPTSGLTKGKGLPMHTPLALSVDGAGNLYVAEHGSHIIRQISTSGEMRVLAGVPRVPSHYDHPNPLLSYFSAPAGLALDAAGTSLYVVDHGNAA